MTDIWSFLLQTLTGSGVAVLLLVLKAMFRDKLSPRWQFAVWGVLAMVLLLPAGLRGRYVLVNWPFLVELCRSFFTGEYGALARVTVPVPLPVLEAPRTLGEWLFAVYGAGVVVLLLWYVLSYVRLRLALRQGRPAEEGRVRTVAEGYRLPVCPAVEVEGLSSAFICGVFKPVLVLPAGRETEDKVLLHELCHLKYLDAAWGLLICLLRCLHWCNPLLWYCADRAGNDLESLCDQRVLERLEGEERRDYGRILLDMANDRYARAPGTSSMANGGKNIRRRIEAIARFKRYPAGMGLVSVCVLLVLAAPLAAGVKAEVPGLGAVNVPAQLARARTTPCTTCAGAFDTYAKAMLTGRFDYRAMCAPLAEQNDLAEKYRISAAQGHWEWLDSDLLDLNADPGYQIYNLAQVEENACEGLLAVTLNRAPKGVEWSGLAHERWMAVQPLRAEKEGDRWVVIPQGKLTAMQGDVRSGGNLGLPAWEYTATAGDFTLRMRWQTTSQVDSYGEPNWFGQSFFGTTPIPDGEFTSRFDQIILADYHGAPEDRGKYRSIGVVSMPMWGEEERPELELLAPPDRNPDAVNWSGGSNDGSEWAQRTLDYDWGKEDMIFLSGGGSSREGLIQLPAAFAADFYLNGEKVAELTLRPVKGGMSLA